MKITHKKFHIALFASVILCVSTFCGIAFLINNLQNESFAISSKSTTEHVVDLRFLNTQNLSSLSELSNNESNLIKTKDGKYVLIDTAENNANMLNVIYDALKEYQGVDSVIIDYLIVSHMDSDHFGNAAAIINNSNITVKNIVIKYEKTLFESNSTGGKIEGNPGSKEKAFNNIISAAKTENARIYIGSNANALSSLNGYGKVSYIGNEGYSIVVDDNLTLYFYNVDDVYTGVTCDDGVKMSWTKAYGSSNLYTFNSTLDGSLYYVKFDGRNYLNPTFERELYVEGQPVDGDNNNPKNVNSYFYAIQMKSIYTTCRSNGNSYGVLAEVTVDNGNHKYVYYANDLDNYGYDIYPTEEQVTYTKTDGSSETITHNVYGNGGGVLFNPSVISDEATTPADKKTIATTGGRLVYYHRLDDSYKVYSETKSALEIRDKVGENNLSDIVIYQESHHGFNNAPDAINILGLNHKGLYSIANSHYNIPNRSQFSDLRAYDVLSRTDESETRYITGKEVDSDGVYCAIGRAGDVACDEDEIDEGFTYTLNYNYNGGSGSLAEKTCSTLVANTCSVTIPSNIPTRDGYTFLGWANSEEATAKAYDPGANITLTDNKIIYAVWEAIPEQITFTLSFDANGGENAPNPVSCTTTGTNCSVIIPNGTPNRDGYTFLGWANSRAATVKDYDPSDEINLTENKTVYAVWEAIPEEVTFTLSFDANNGENAPSPVSCTTTGASCSVNIPTSTPNRNGYTFLGWANSRAATVKDYDPSDSVNLTENKTVYAVWEAIPEQITFTLSFDANNGENAPNSVSCNTTGTNCSVTIPSSTPNRNGYTFLGWANSRAATVKDYDPSDSVNLTENKTVYAVWEAIPEQITFTLSFDANNGENAPSPVSCTTTGSNCNVTIPSSTPSRNGYTFLGWANSRAATVKDYDPGAAISLTADKAVYAVWEAIPEQITFALSFDANNGENAPSPVSCTTTGSNCNVTISSSTPTRNGYTFLGWADSRAATVKDYDPSDEINLTENKTVYAVWEAIPEEVTFTLSFDANNGENAPSPVSCTTTGASCSVNIPTSTPNRNGYTFLGWANSRAATVKDYAPGASISLTGNKIIYAVWEAIPEEVTFTVSFDANNGENAPNSVSCNTTGTNCSVTIPSSTPNRNGYTFLGWANSRAATVKDYDPGVAISLTADKTIYAVWEAIPEITFTLTFNANNGENAPNPVSCNTTGTNCSVIIPNGTPTRNGYTFLGWANSRAATAKDYDPSDSVDLTENKIIYAVWEKNAEPEPTPTPEPEPTPEPKPDQKPDDGHIVVPNTGANTTNGDEVMTVILSIAPIAMFIILSGCYIVKESKKHRKFD